MLLRFLLLALPLTLAASAQAQLSQIDMTDKEILAFLSGNTIGAHDWGTEESFEYHGSDGEAIWKENEDIQVGIYRVKGGDVCYAYENTNFEEWYCWDFKKDRRTGEVYQWGEFGDFYRLFIQGEGDLVSGQTTFESSLNKDCNLPGNIGSESTILAIEKFLVGENFLFFEPNDIYDLDTQNALYDLFLVIDLKSIADDVRSAGIMPSSTDLTTWHNQLCLVF